MTKRRGLVALALSALLTTACGTGERPSFVDDQGAAGATSTRIDDTTTSGAGSNTDAEANPADTNTEETNTAETNTGAETTTGDAGERLPGGEVGSVPAPNGRTYPVVPTDAAALAQELIEVEQALADPITDPASLPDLGHRQQVLYRVMARDPSITAEMFAGSGVELEANIADHLGARRSFIQMGRDREAPKNVPAWNIVEPEPLEQLMEAYQQAEASTGIEWEYLAAINLVETGMGRIRGVSTAGAQGPMQFLPTTWAEPGIGEGDINNEYDAIAAAARYLVRRGGPDDMAKALYGYNNAVEYVEAVTHYADMFRRNQTSLVGPYHWEIHYSADIGDLWMPVGYSQPESLDAEQFVVEAPWSVPPWGLTDRPPPTTAAPEPVVPEEAES